METIKDIFKKKDELIKLKKATTKLTDAWGSPSKVSKASTSKMDATANKISKTIVGNTYYWLDSHDDVHVKGCFSKSISENKNVFHLHDHEFKIASQVGKISALREDTLEWSTFGVTKEGFTTSLVADTDILKELNPMIFKGYANGEINQHSVGMQYVKIDLAIKERDDEYGEENKNWDEIYPLLGNPEKADEKGYLWIVREAKLIEISAVLMGSNELTPTLDKSIEPSQGTHTDEADTKSLQFYKHLI